MNRILTAFRLDRGTKIKLKKLSKQLDISQSAIARIALNAFIKKHLDAT